MPVSKIVDSLIIPADSVQTTSGNDSSWILHHIMDSRELDFEPFFTIHIPQFPTLFGLDITPTKHVFFMWLTALLLVILFYIVARSYKKSLVPKGIANVFEVMILFVRDEIVKPTIGEGYEKFVPYLLTLFFFI
ncbi:MAG: F0F1 ATP synthase subunit A, partial [Bacteroidetes bacterium]|nr:F0F1 ATP synthase subunit A [Bacteroidota bacterium]